MTAQGGGPMSGYPNQQSPMGVSSPAGRDNWNPGYGAHGAHGMAPPNGMAHPNYGQVPVNGGGVPGSAGGYGRNDHGYGAPPSAGGYPPAGQAGNYGGYHG